MRRLDGKIALVTGAANGMGAAHVEYLVSEGANVVATDIDVQNGRELARRLGDACRFTFLDVTKTDSWAAAVAHAQAEFGRVNVLVNNAGISGDAVKLLDITEAEYRKTIEIDLHGTYNGMRAVLPGMIAAGGGSIINISSTAGFISSPAVNVGYVAAKFAVRGLTKQVALEYATQNVRVNTVHPGPIRTALTQALLDDLGSEFEERFYDFVPMRRLGESSEIAKVVGFLASDDSSYMTGSELVADGGYLSI